MRTLSEAFQEQKILAQPHKSVVENVVNYNVECIKEFLDTLISNFALQIGRFDGFSAHEAYSWLLKI